MSKWMLFYVMLVLAILIGCTSLHDASKKVEGAIYDNLAEAASDYCNLVEDKPLMIQRTRIEARREMRQRGSHGPIGPIMPVEGLDDNTAYGPGPVVVIYCSNDLVPREVYENMVRDWQD